MGEDQVEVLRVVGTVGGQGVSEAWREGRPSPAFKKPEVWKGARERGRRVGGEEVGWVASQSILKALLEVCVCRGWGGTAESCVQVLDTSF